MTVGFPVAFEGGPRDGESDVLDRVAPAIGDGSAKGVYQRTEELRDGKIVFRWQALTDAQAEALLRGDLRANQR